MSTNNRMVEKSKKAIKDALLDIMYEKDFKQITVNELLKRANVSRGTFYAHFSNLEDVRQQLINDLFEHADYLFGDYTASELEKDPYPIMLMAADMMIASRDPAKRLFKFVNVYDLGINLRHGSRSIFFRTRSLLSAGAARRPQRYTRASSPAASCTHTICGYLRILTLRPRFWQKPCATSSSTALKHSKSRNNSKRHS